MRTCHVKHVLTSLLMLAFASCGGEQAFTGTPKLDFTPTPQDGGGGDNGPTTVRKTVYKTGTDSFPGNDLQQQDFLFVIDDSGSMFEEIQAVKNSVQSFVSGMQARRVVDYRAAVTTTNSREVQGNLITSSSNKNVIGSSISTDPISELQQMLAKIQAGTQGSWNYMESGLEAAKLAISKHGSVFSRPDVPLAVIILSDEEDKSCDITQSSCLSYRNDRNCTQAEWDAGTCPLYDLNAYKGYLSAIPKTIHLFPIVGKSTDTPGSVSCPNLAVRGLRYEDMTKIWPGETHSICSGTSISDSVLAIAKSVSDRGICMKLTKNSTGANISVMVDGVAVPADPVTGFKYDAPTKSVCFAGSYVPNGSSDIQVTYQYSEVIFVTE